MNKLIPIIAITALALGLGAFFTLNWQKLPPLQTITNFEECARAGYLVGESFPRQCWTPDGRRLIEQLTIEEAKDQLSWSLLDKPGVVGVGIGECAGEPCIKVMLEKELKDVAIPSESFGFKVEMEVTGTIRALLPGSITIAGEITCMPKTGQGTQTMECAIGLKGTDGRHYGLKNLFKIDPEYKFSVTDLRVEVSGMFSSDEIRGPDGNKYDVVVIDATSIKEIWD